MTSRLLEEQSLELTTSFPRGSQVHSEKVIGATNSYEKELEPGSILSKSWEHGVFKTKVNNSFVG